MMQLCFKARDVFNALRTDKDGVVSLEYVIVAACVCAVVVFVFNGTGSTSLNGILQGGFSAISNSVTSVTSG
jgi:Flp pilus assembly pilin Flp